MENAARRTSGQPGCTKPALCSRKAPYFPRKGQAFDLSKVRPRVDTNNSPFNGPTEDRITASTRRKTYYECTEERSVKTRERPKQQKVVVPTEAWSPEKQDTATEQVTRIPVRRSSRISSILYSNSPKGEAKVPMKEAPECNTPLGSRVSPRSQDNKIYAQDNKMKGRKPSRLPVRTPRSNECREILSSSSSTNIQSALNDNGVNETYITQAAAEKSDTKASKTPFTPRPTSKTPSTAPPTSTTSSTAPPTSTTSSKAPPTSTFQTHSKHNAGVSNTASQHTTRAALEATSSDRDQPPVDTEQYIVTSDENSDEDEQMVDPLSFYDEVLEMQSVDRHEVDATDKSRGTPSSKWDATPTGRAPYQPVTVLQELMEEQNSECPASDNESDQTTGSVPFPNNNIPMLHNLNIPTIIIWSPDGTILRKIRP